MWQDFPRVIGLAVAVVGLLHDVGHPPFSHVLERFYQERMVLVMGADAAHDQAEYAALTGQAQFHEWAGLRIFDNLPTTAFVTYHGCSFGSSCPTGRETTGPTACTASSTASSTSTGSIT
jgi:hypothetical protein